MEERAVKLTVSLDVDEELLDRLHRRAIGNARSTEEEIRSILAQAVQPVSKEEGWKRINAFREELQRSGRVFSPSEDLIRQDRDER